MDDDGAERGDCDQGQQRGGGATRVGPGRTEDARESTCLDDEGDHREIGGRRRKKNDSFLFLGAAICHRSEIIY